ncbi:MAG TPA: hypothetical protein VIM48_03800 [Chthoniobacterales bacterium]
MSGHEDPAPEVSRELYETPAETEAAIERIHGHFQSIRKAMAEEKTARGPSTSEVGFPAKRTKSPG